MLFIASFYINKRIMVSYRPMFAFIKHLGRFNRMHRHSCRCSVSPTLETSDRRELVEILTSFSASRHLNEHVIRQQYFECANSMVHRRQVLSTAQRDTYFHSTRAKLNASRSISNIASGYSTLTLRGLYKPF